MSIADSYTIEYTTNYPIVIPSASHTAAGVMSAADKIKLDALGPGGGTLASVYAAGVAPADSTMLLTAAGGGVRIWDDVVPIGVPLFEVASAAGTTAYLRVNATSTTMRAPFTVADQTPRIGSQSQLFIVTSLVDKFYVGGDGSTVGDFGGDSELTAGRGADGDGVTVGGTGGNVLITASLGGTDGGAGPGANGGIQIATLNGRNSASAAGGGSGGQFSITGGDGGDAFGAGAGGSGSTFSIRTGIGGAASATGAAGNGGSLSLATQQGGSGSGAFPGAKGGNITVTSGVGGIANGAGSGGDGGNISIVCGNGAGPDFGPAGFGGILSFKAGDGGGASFVASGLIGALLIATAGSGGDDDGVLGAGPGGPLEIHGGVAGVDNGGGGNVGGVVSVQGGNPTGGLARGVVNIQTASGPAGTLNLCAVGGKLGFYGVTAVVRAAHPVLLADVITILTNVGLCS